MNEERNGFRYTVGLIAVIGGFAGLIALYFIEIPAGNRDSVTLALGIVLGWGGSVINGEWGSSPAGREAAKVGVRSASYDVQQVEVHNSPQDPLHVIDDVKKEMDL